MSRENIEAVYEGAEAINRGDVEAALSIVDETIVFEPLRASVEGDYHGHDGIRRFFADNAENWAEFHVTHSEVLDAGNDRVLAIGKVRTRGRGSGVETDVNTAAVYTFRDGLLVHYKDFGDERAARQAVGLNEEDGR